MAKKRIYYLDTNAILPLVSLYAATDWMEELRDHPVHWLVVSEVAQLEFLSVVYRQCKNGELSHHRRDEMLAVFATLLQRDRTITRLPTAEHFRLAKQLVQSNPGLTAPDALHVAISLDFQDRPDTAVLVSGDEKVLDAAQPYHRRLGRRSIHCCRCPKCGRMNRVHSDGVQQHMRCKCGQRCDPCIPEECEKYRGRLA